jgi:hypothetical protein
VASVRRLKEAKRDDITLYTDKHIEQSRQFQVAATALFVSAGITGALGTSLWLLNRKETSRAIALDLSPNGLTLSGRF